MTLMVSVSIKSALIQPCLSAGNILLSFDKVMVNSKKFDKSMDTFSGEGRLPFSFLPPF